MRRMRKGMGKEEKRKRWKGVDENARIEGKEGNSGIKANGMGEE